MNLSERVLQASAGRDRVIDATKTMALLLVILGHGLAWTITPDGGTTNTLEAAPNLYPLTWILQILPVFFFLAGAGMVRYAKAPNGPGLLARAGRLITPTVPLYLLTLALSGALALTIGGATAQAAAILPIQLTWFIGIYLIVLALSPILARLTTWWHYAAFLGVILVVDALRANVASDIGWINLVLVWAYFTAAGMHLPRLRALPRTTLASGAALSAALAVLAVAIGPYSKALITTPALPGLSNLAPPTIVLALAGTTQILILLLAWPALDRLLRNDRLWVPVAVFSSRAIGVYLWHMLILSLLVGAVILTGTHPDVLSLPWWGLHIAVLAGVCLTVWIVAPVGLRLGDIISRSTCRLVPKPLQRTLGQIPGWAATTTCLLIGLGYVLASEAGLSDPLTGRLVLGLPYLPAALILILVLASGMTRASQDQAQ